MNKSDFPIFLSYPDLVYLDSAATSQKPREVIDAVREFYEKYNAPIHRSMYPLGDMATGRYEGVREKAAQFLGADVREVVFTKSATEAVNLVCFGWARHHIKEGDEIIVSLGEHHANFVPWQQFCFEKGIHIQFAPLDNNGVLRADSLLKFVGEKTKLVTFSLASNVTGSIFDAKDVIQKIREKNPNVKIVVDAAQAVGRIPVNFKELQTDFLACSGHKFYGPSGVGMLLIKKTVHPEMQPFLTGGGMIRTVSKEKTTFQEVPDIFEGGTPQAEAVIGLGAAIDYINACGIQNIRNHEMDLLSYALEKLNQCEGFHVMGPVDVTKRIGVISFYHDSVHAHDIASILGEENICIRAGHHCAIPLHKELGIPATARMSFSLFTEPEDIDKTIKILKAIHEAAGV